MGFTYFVADSAGWARLHIIHRRLRPAVRIPTQRHYCQGGFSIHSKVTLEIRREPILSLRVQSPRMSRADQRAVGRCQEQTAAAVQHVHTGFVQVGSGDGFAPPDANVVSALRALATATPVHKQIIIVVMPAQIRGFDGFIVSDGKQLRIRRHSFAGLRIELNQFDAGPIRTKSHPQAAVAVVKYGRVNRIVTVAVLRPHHEPLIGPMIGRIVRVQSGIGRQTDGRGHFPERRNRVIKEIPIAQLDDVGSPVLHVAVFWNDLGNPFRCRLEYSRPAFPFHQVLGMIRRHAAARVEDPVFIFAFHDAGRIASGNAATRRLFQRQDGKGSFARPVWLYSFVRLP